MHVNLQEEAVYILAEDRIGSLALIRVDTGDKFSFKAIKFPEDIRSLAKEQLKLGKNIELCAGVRPVLLFNESDQKPSRIYALQDEKTSYWQNLYIEEYGMKFAEKITCKEEALLVQYFANEENRLKKKPNIALLALYQQGKRNLYSVDNRANLMNLVKSIWSVDAADGKDHQALSLSTIGLHTY